MGIATFNPFCGSRMSRLMALVCVALSTASCATTEKQAEQIDHALLMCKELRGPDADKADGEATFWMQSERVKASRKLWNRRGISAIDARLVATTDEGDRGCLTQIRQEAIERRVVE
ncbi:MAG: hypothetical protein QM719_09220 [Thermomonas sp.]